ncbi:MAG: hypothetical protein ABR577_07020 [Pyrinomonadaceae bacterium]
MCVLTISGAVFAQSTEADFPTPITANEISGKIAARDVGDPRLTRHFYLLSATPGDLLITVESGNLNGDVDLFTLGSLRPLSKVSVYAGDAATRATKSIFLKERQQIILRVEARSANDGDGLYRIRFEGSFEPLSGASLASNVPSTPMPEVSSGKGGVRVTATGARIPEEVKEPIAEAKSPVPETPAATVATTQPSAPATAPPTAARVVKPIVVPRRAPRTTSAPPASSARPRPASPTVRRSASRPPAKPATAKPAVPVPSVAASPRLIVELRDGAKTERFMTTVRRVTIDNDQLVIVGKDGRIERQPLLNVLRFTIEP